MLTWMSSGVRHSPRGSGRLTFAGSACLLAPVLVMWRTSGVFVTEVTAPRPRGVVLGRQPSNLRSRNQSDYRNEVGDRWFGTSIVVVRAAAFPPPNEPSTTCRCCAADHTHAAAPDASIESRMSVMSG